MFRLTGLLIIALSTTALADDKNGASPQPPPVAASRSKVPLRVVRVMADNEQAVLFDRSRNAMVVVLVGSKVAGYTVEAIDEDEVTLAGTNGAQIILAAPQPPQAAEPKAATKASTETSSTESAPVDPYGDGAAPSGPVANTDKTTADTSDKSAANKTSPSTSTADATHKPAPDAPDKTNAADKPTTKSGPDATDRTATNKSGPDATDRTATNKSGSDATDGTATSKSGPNAADKATNNTGPDTTDRTPTKSNDTTDKTATNKSGPDAADRTATNKSGPDATDRTAPGIAPDSRTSDKTVAPDSQPDSRTPLRVVVSSAEIDSALENFGLLIGSVRGAFTPTGVRIDLVADGSMFAKLGVRAGDVVASVDGKPLRALDDAADLYARGSSARTVTVQVVRGGKPITLEIAIRSSTAKQP